MTAGVVQASMAAGFTPAGHRSAQADHSSNAFSETLDMQHTGSSVDHRPHQDARDKGSSVHEAHAAAANAEERATAGTETRGDNGDALGALEQAVSDEADADMGAEDHKDAGVPAQIKAEQTISALMAMAPIARRGSAEAGQHARNASGSDSAGSDRRPAIHRAAPAETMAEKASETLAGKQLSQVKARRLAEVTDKASAPAPGAQSVSDPAAGKTPAQIIGALPNKLQLHVVDTAGAGRHNPENGIEMKSPSGEATLTVSRNLAATSAKNGGDSNPGSFAFSKRAAVARRGEPESAAGQISVLSQQAAPAPAAPALNANAAAIVSTLGADQDLRAAAAGSAVHSASAFKSAQPMRTLKIQLHPAELGVVTAKLKSTGDQLTVELQVDNHEAYHRLSADSDAIASSLRSLGYAIDRISIQQPQAANAGAASSDAGSLSRDASSFQSGNSSNSGERSGGQASGRGDRGGTERSDQAYQGSSGGGLYI